jgi:tetratricopeptide (TPR) repeat protein
MMARARSSKVQYIVQAETIGSDPANAFWPLAGLWIDSPVVSVSALGVREVRSRQCSPEANRELEATRAILRDRRYSEAAASLNESTKRHPDCVEAFKLRAEALQLLNDSARALDALDWAEALVPDDARVATERGETLLRLGRRDDALAAFRKALSLWPRYEFAMLSVGRNARGLDVSLDKGFVVRALARGSAPRIDIYVEKDLGVREAKAWTAYGICKAFWIGNAQHRRRVTGNEALGFSVLEEEECIRQLVAQSSGSTDPTLTRLRSIVVDSQLLDAFINYEFAARVDPTAVLRLPPEARARVARYVDEYVLVDARRTPALRPAVP